MDTRQQQVKALLTRVANIKEKFKNIYEVLWYDPKINQTVCLCITLPPQFPAISPVFSVAPRIAHPWVDANGLIVGHKYLGANWNQYVSLADITNEIIKELQSNKPTIPPYPEYNSLGRMYNNSSYYYNNSLSPPPPPPRPLPPVGMPTYSGYSGMSMNIPSPNIPPLPQPYKNTINNNNNNIDNNNSNLFNNNTNKNNVDLGDLQSLSLEELKELLNNDNKRKEYINEKDKIKEMHKVKEEMSLSNKNLAEKIIANREDFERLKSDLQQQQDILKDEREKFEFLIKEQNKYVANYTPTQLHSSLQQATAKADEDSEEIANDFLMGMTNSDEFLKKYRKLRKSYHLRAEKMELFSNNRNTLFT